MPFNLLKNRSKWRAYKKQIPTLIANDGRKIWLDAFKYEGFDQEDWPELSIITINKKLKRKKGSKKVKPLVDTGQMKRAVSNSIAKVKWRRVEWRVKGIGYAAYHNYGDEDGGTPKRQFMGDCIQLRKKIDFRLRKLDRLFKGTS